MLTLAELCADMAAMGRDLTPRAARDWWTKGILSKPDRRGLGRGKGTETFWADPRVRQRAQIAYDLLAAHPRADTAILGVWLHGFRVNLDTIREIYLRSIDHHFRSVRGRSRRPLSEWVYELADRGARQSAKTSAAPKEVRSTLADLGVEFLGVFYEPRKERSISGLASRWKNAAPHLGGAAWDEVHLTDDDLATGAQYLGEMASLPTQCAAIASATPYELMRARRLVFFAFGCLARVGRANGLAKQFEKVNPLAIVDIGRLVPILIAVLRNKTLRRLVVSGVLYYAKIHRQLQWKLPRAGQ
jgi:hypothetical protein